MREAGAGLRTLKGNWGLLVAMGIVLVACLLLVEALIKIGIMPRERFETGRWGLAGGAIDLALGLLIWRRWPESA